jgi:hypothetical protein
VIRYRSSHGYPFGPWPSQYLARYPVTFGPRGIRSGDLIRLFATDAEPRKRGGGPPGAPTTATLRLARGLGKSPASHASRSSPAGCPAGTATPRMAA